MPTQRLKDFLEQKHIPYVTINHPPAYTAQQVAAAAHVPGKELAKTVMLKVGGRMVMAVVPACCRIDFTLLKAALGTEDVRLAGEREFADQFPETEPGAMAPFGNLYGMDVIVARKLTEDKAIAFNAGSHTELVKIAYKDYENSVHPRVMRFAYD